MCFLWYFQEHNQIPENIFRNIFWNAIKHIKTFSFSKRSEEHTSELQSNDPHSTDLVDRSIAPIKQRSTPTPLDLASATRSHLRIHRTISPLDQTQSPLSLPFSLNLTEFDEIFFLGFVSFVFLYWLDLMNFFPGFCFFCVSILRNDIIYLFDSWEDVRKCEQ